jgi:hypothetical protein
MTPAEATPKTDQISSKSERTILTSNNHIRDHMADHCTMNPASSCRASRAVILSIGFRAPRPVHVYEATAESRIVRFWHFSALPTAPSKVGYRG